MINKMKELIDKLNTYRNEYYNNNISCISDKAYDTLYDELVELEKETGVTLSNSPTQSVGYTVNSKLEKVKHSHPMLSLDKTTSVDELLEFMKQNDCNLMLKDDGLTISLTYEDGKLVRGETRGNGEVGELITDNVKQFTNIPLTINKQGKYVIDGEAIITYNDFEEINSEIEDESKRYKNPRNLASGSVRQLDSSITKERKVKFLAWKVIEGNMSNSQLSRLIEAKNLGFEITDVIPCTSKLLTKEVLESYIELLKTTANDKYIPIDGLVAVIDNIKYGNSLGLTAHHPRHSLSFKFYQEHNTTILREVEWSTTRTGLINPVAIFDSVEIDGTDVSRASLHNLNIIEDLELGIGDEISVIKANQIIPQVVENNTRSNTLQIPKVCPCCGQPTTIEVTDSSKVLKCTNDNCRAKLISRLENFCSKKCMNVQGLSSATLEKFIELEYLNEFADIYKLEQYKDEIIKLDGFGEKSYNKLIDSINKSRKCRHENLLASLGIEGVGLNVAKLICKKFDIDQIIKSHLNYACVEGIGDKLSNNINQYIKNNKDTIIRLLDELDIYKEDEPETSNENLLLQGKVFVITGKLNQFKNRDELVAKIESLGGKVSGSVSKNVNYLINNDVTSTTGKNKKAKELGIQIISEQDFIDMIDM